MWYTGGMPTDARPLALDDEIRAAIGGAFDSLNFVTVAYNGDDGWPHVSRRGSTHVYGPQQIAIWVRKREDGLAKAVDTRPEVTLFYVDLVERGVAYTFYGRVGSRTILRSPIGCSRRRPRASKPRIPSARASP